MMVIFRNTLKSYFTLKFITLYFLSFILLFIGFAALLTFTGGDIITYEFARDEFLANYFIVTNLCTLGLPYLFILASRGVSCFQQEIEENTFILLISKPVTRKQIFFEKLLALFVTGLIMGVLSLLLSLSLYILIYQVDSVILNMYLALVPGVIIYQILITAIMLALAISLAVFLKQRQKAVIILIAFIMIFQLVLPLMKPLLIDRGIYERYYLYLIDANYHFGLIYYRILSLFTKIVFSPFAQLRINSFIGIFPASNQYVMDTDLGFYPNNYVPADYLNPHIVLSFWAVATLVLFWISYRTISRRDIN